MLASALLGLPQASKPPSKKEVVMTSKERLVELTRNAAPVYNPFGAEELEAVVASAARDIASAIVERDSSLARIALLANLRLKAHSHIEEADILRERVAAILRGVYNMGYKVGIEQGALWNSEGRCKVPR